MKYSENELITVVIIFVIMMSVFYEMDLREKEQEIQRLKSTYEPKTYVDKEWPD